MFTKRLGVLSLLINSLACLIVVKALKEAYISKQKIC